MSRNEMWCAAGSHNCMSHLCAKGFLVRILMMELLTKYQIFSKLPQITHIYKNRNFSGIIVTFRPTASAL